MSQSTSLVSLIGACLLSLAISPMVSTAKDEQTRSARLKWEYKKTKDLDEKQLNQLGEEGWELVAVEPKLPYVEVRTRFKTEVTGSVTYTERLFYFKRPK